MFICVLNIAPTTKYSPWVGLSVDFAHASKILLSQTTLPTPIFRRCNLLVWIALTHINKNSILRTNVWIYFEPFFRLLRTILQITTNYSSDYYELMFEFTSNYSSDYYELMFEFTANYSPDYY